MLHMLHLPSASYASAQPNLVLPQATAPALISLCGCTEPIDVFRSIREKKNNF